MSTASLWVPVKEDVESIDWQGKDIILKEVPAERNQKTKAVRVRLDEVMKAEQKYLADGLGLDPRNIPELLLLFAAPRFIKSGHVEQKYRFNKMLFYHRKEMEKQGYGDSYIYDEFGSGRAGPVPVSLKDDLGVLEEKGIVELSVTRDGKTIEKGRSVLEARQPGTALKVQLTKRGETVAKAVWDNTPDDIKNVVLYVKKDLFLVDAAQLKEKVHRDYPEYRKTYTELDTE